MRRTKVTIKISNASSSLDDNTLILSDIVRKKWKIPVQTPLTLCFGSAKHEVKVVTTTLADVLRIHASIAALWGLSHGDSLCLQYKANDQTLHIGPLIGVLISRINSVNVEKPFGSTTAFYRELNDTCRLFGASICFITPDELNDQSQTVNGWRYTGKWEQRTFPMPHVIYNRLTSRKLENRDNVQQFFRHAKTQHQAILFNEKYLNKTEVFDALNNATELHKYLPESHLLRNFEILKSMCAKYPVIFLKPVTGSLGKGIIRVTRQADLSYVGHFTNLNGARKQSFPSLSRFFSAISGKIKQQRYQIQQGLDLICIEGQPLDFRALVQRNELGEWEVTSIVARIAGNQQFVSNLARGGRLSTVKDALEHSHSTAAAGCAPKLRRAALLIANGIEKHISAHFAELGIDLAVDTQGRIWLLEVNSKPSKEDNTPLWSEGKVRPSVKRIVQYSRYAAKF
ncbi:YheC/YheD family endospore coat-associated protein [Paenibacillus sp. UNC451MF]|uniref:YheC/YheD family endospore coat-associated protein n=1 Tax=Paenibacillus sp. UNC451MF TaxID=1449063 RepID=UPI000491359E|nr:YheC/YheD family protein [Paenibacillus sp. UNC451MF]